VASSAINHLQDSKIPPDAKSLTESAGILTNVANLHPDVSEVWRTAGRLVSYRSEGNAADAQTLLNASLPNCADHDPTHPTVISATPNQFKVQFSIYENCRLTLDSDRDAAKVNYLLETETMNLTFRHCLIVYRGGNIKMILAWHNRVAAFHKWNNPNPDSNPLLFNGPTLLFENCVFDFQLNGMPPVPGQDFTRSLLASDEKALSFTTEKS
jgi:hypothetical protein